MCEKICIYGAGKYGIHTYLKLKHIGINVDFFADRNENKSGYAMDGKYCITYDKLVSLDKENIVIILGVNDHLSLIQNFEKIGFKKVYRADDYIKLSGCNYNIEYRNPINDKNCLLEMKNVLVDIIYQNHFQKNIALDCDFEGIVKDYQIRNNVDENPRS